MDCKGPSLSLDMTLLFDFASEVVHEGINLTGRYPFVRLHMQSCGRRWSSSGVLFLYAVVTCALIGQYHFVHPARSGRIESK